MAARDFEEFIKNCREEFRWRINGYINGSRELKDILKKCSANAALSLKRRL